MQNHSPASPKVQSVLTLTILIGVLLFSSCGQKPVSNTESTALNVNEQGLLDLLYAGLDEDSLQSGAVPGGRDKLELEALLPGSYTDSDTAEMLVVARVNPDNLPHAAGFRHLLMGVYALSSGQLSSKTQHFFGDVGEYVVFHGVQRSHVAYAGAVIYQGHASRDGGVFTLDHGEWSRTWPETSLFWEKYAIDLRDTGIRVMRPVEKLDEDGAFPNIVWEFDHFLDWIPSNDIFSSNSVEY